MPDTYTPGGVSIEKTYRYDWSEEKNTDLETEFWSAYLPHRCGSWDIGGILEIDLLILDLMAAKTKIIEANEKDPARTPFYHDTAETELP
jgi:hypothetical protein